jgi:hypothetical protein
VFVAEPVGSCTDLVATVTYPLRRMYGDQFTIAPLSVLVDPIRASRVLGLTDGGTFSSKVLYIYRKQLEEAGLIVINKTDLLDPGRLAALASALANAFPRAEILAVSARSGAGCDAWFDKLAAGQPSWGAGAAMEVDYGLYADGEALLGWLNSTIRVGSPGLMDGNAALKSLARELHSRLNAQGVEVAHLKMTLSPETGLSDIAVINLVRNDYVPELSQELSSEISGGQLILNLRAEAAPELLGAAVREALPAAAGNFAGLTFTIDHVEHFRPGKPEPTHRLASLAV